MTIGLWDGNIKSEVAKNFGRLAPMVLTTLCSASAGSLGVQRRCRNVAGIVRCSLRLDTGIFASYSSTSGVVAYSNFSDETSCLPSPRTPEMGVIWNHSHLSDTLTRRKHSRGIATIVESRLRDVVDNKSTRGEIDGVMKFLMKQFDTLSLPEVLLALKLVRATAHIPEYHTARSHLQPNLSQRAVYLLSTLPDVSEEALVSFLRLGSHSFFRTADLSQGFEVVLEKVSVPRLLRELTSIHRLRTVSSVRHVLSKFIYSIPTEFSPRSLREACLLIDLCVTCDIVDRDRRLVHLCERALSFLESCDKERYALFGTIELLVQDDHSHLLDLDCLRSFIEAIVSRGLFPSKETPSRTHVYLAKACSRIGGSCHEMSQNAFDLFLKAMSFDALEPQELRFQVDVCTALVFQDATRSYTSEGGLSDAVKRFVSSLSRRHNSDPHLLVGYARLADELGLHVSAYRWWSWCDKMVAFQETGNIKADDLLLFIGLVSESRSCPPSLKRSILKTLNALALLEIRRSDSLSAGVVNMVLSRSDFDDSLRQGIQLSLTDLNNNSSIVSETHTGTISEKSPNAAILVNR